MDEPRGHYSRGYLPHVDAGETPQFVTWRLEDAIPIWQIKELEHEYEREPEHVRKRETYRRIERYLDEGHGSELLKNPVASGVMRDSLFFGHGQRYILHSWVIMPTHVHVLFTPCLGWQLMRILKDLKGFTSKEIGKKLGLEGRIWHADYFDRWIRDEQHFHATARYIEWNPVKAKLCADPKLYPNSSANPLMRERLLSRLPDETSGNRGADETSGSRGADGTSAIRTVRVG